MKRTIIVFLFTGMSLTALLFGVSCSNQTPNTAFVTPLNGLATANPAWTATWTPTFTPTPSFTPTPIPYPISGFSAPYGLAIDSKNNIYVGDSGHAVVDQYVNGVQNTAWPSGKVKSNGLAYTAPQAIAADTAGNIYVVGNSNNAVWKFDQFGNYSFQYSASTSIPQGVAVYGAPASVLYVSDTSAKQIFSIALPGGAANTSFGTSGHFASSLSYRPYGLTVDSLGNLYVAGDDNNVHIYSSTGSAPLPSGSVSIINGFNLPYAVAIDSNNNLYVSDTNNGQIEEFTYGNYSSPANVFGLGTLSHPRGIAVDSSANVYVVDSGDGELFQFPN